MSVKFRFPFFILISIFIAAGCKATPDQTEIDATSTKVAESVFATLSASVPSATSTPKPTSTPQFTATPTPTLTPTPIPAVIAGWDNFKATSVCIDVLQEYPQFEESVALPVYETVAQILNKMGINVSQDKAACDATLAIGFEGTVYDVSYSGDGEKLKCYTGARVNGYMRLSQDGYESIDLPISASNSPVAIFGGCSKSPTPNVGWDKVWVPEVVNGMADIWGAPVAAAALKVGDNAIHKAGVHLVSRFGAGAGETVPALTAMLVEQEGGVAYTDIADALKRIGPAAMSAVPVLIEYLEKELANTGLVNFAYHYDNALAAITGKKTDDPSFWKGWWKNEWLDLINQPDVETLTKTLGGDSDPETRRMAAILLGNLGSNDDTVIQAFTKAISDEQIIFVRVAILNAIENLGPQALPILPALVEYGPSVKYASEEWAPLKNALSAMGIEAIPALVEAGQNESGTWPIFLHPLRRITGDEWDMSVAGEAYIQSVTRFLERCKNYYHEQTGN